VQIDAIRHSLSHLLAAAVLKKFSDAKLAIGPTIENGFYYDFLLPRSLTPEDLKEFEKGMRRLLEQNLQFSGKPVTAAEAKRQFKDQPFKLELIEEFSKEGKELTVYKTGEIFFDLCRGGHVKNTREIPTDAFKLDKLAGAYWRGDEKNPMLQRIYGLAFCSREQLDAHLAMRAEAEKRDHKKLGQELDLFTFSELVGAGLPLFLPKGAWILSELTRFIREEKGRLGYTFVTIPHIARAAIYRKSGHLGKYDAMMPLMKDAQGDEYAIKAMNCPHHFEIFNARPHSYRDLPFRIAETTTVYRNEKSGELSGLVRVKSLTQDDTHHVITNDQIASEMEMILGLMDRVYKVFQFHDYRVQVSIRDPKTPEKYFGDDALWKKSEAILIAAVKRWGRPYVVEEGEAAFYGPKIDIMVKDSIGREWQLTTVQLDFSQPENFHLRYTGEDGNEHAPAVIHAAILGSLERFFGILIEHYAGAFPVWLSPVQVVVIPVADRHVASCRKIAKELGLGGIRVRVADSSDTVGYKIRRAEKEKIPYMIVFGDKEKKTKKLQVRIRGSQKLRVLSAATLRETIARQIAKKQ